MTREQVQAKRKLIVEARNQAEKLYAEQMRMLRLECGHPKTTESFAAPLDYECIDCGKRFSRDRY